MSEPIDILIAAPNRRAGVGRNTPIDEAAEMSDLSSSRAGACESSVARKKFAIETVSAQEVSLKLPR